MKITRHDRIGMNALLSPLLSYVDYFGTAWMMMNTHIEKCKLELLD